MIDSPRQRLVTVTTVVVAAAWVVLDQATKMAAVRTYGTQPPDDLGPVILRLIYNEGAAFSLPIQLPWLFVTVTVLVCVLVARALPDTRSVGLAGAYGLVVGGAVGNGLDRIFRDGAVVDMIDLDFWPLTGFPVFNVADIGITVGASAVALLMVLGDRRDRAAQQAVLHDEDAGQVGTPSTAVRPGAPDPAQDPSQAEGSRP